MNLIDLITGGQGANPPASPQESPLDKLKALFGQEAGPREQPPQGAPGLGPLVSRSMGHSDAGNDQFDLMSAIAPQRSPGDKFMSSFASGMAGLRGNTAGAAFGRGFGGAVLGGEQAESESLDRSLKSATLAGKLRDVQNSFGLQKALAKGIPTKPDGSIDYPAFSKMLASHGADLSSITSIAKMQQEQDGARRVQEQLGQMYGGSGQPGPQAPAGPQPSASPSTPMAQPRGLRNNNPLNIESGEFASGQTGYTGSDGRFAQFKTLKDGVAAADRLIESYGRKGINTVEGVINRWAPPGENNSSAYAASVAQRLGVAPTDKIDLNNPDVRRRLTIAMARVENGRELPGSSETPPQPVQMASADPNAVPIPPQPAGDVGATAPQPPSPSQPQVAEAPVADTPETPPAPQPNWRELSRNARQLITMMATPGLPAGQRETIKALLSNELDASKLTNDQKEFMMARSEGYKGSFVDFKKEMKRAGATNVNVGTGEKEYEKQSAKDFAEMNRKMIEGAQSARSKLSTLSRLDQLLSDPKTYTGTGADQVLAAKKLAKAIGIDVGDVSGPEAVKAIGNQFALELRNPAGGAGMPGALSDKDREFLQASVPGLGQTPEGNRKIVDYMKRMAQRSLDVERLRQSYVKDHKRLDEGFYRELEAFSNANPLFPEADAATEKTPNASQPAASEPRSQTPQDQAPVSIQTPDEARELKPGTRFIGPDGQVRIRP